MRYEIKLKHLLTNEIKSYYYNITVAPMIFLKWLLTECSPITLTQMWFNYEIGNPVEKLEPIAVNTEFGPLWEKNERTLHPLGGFSA